MANSKKVAGLRVAITMYTPEAKANQSIYVKYHQSITDLKMQILEPHPTFEAELLGWGWDQLLTKPCFRILRHTKNGLH